MRYVRGMEIEHKRGIAVPPHGNTDMKRWRQFVDLQVHDALLFDAEDEGAVRNFVARFRRQTGRKFTVKPYEGRIGCWRLE